MKKFTITLFISLFITTSAVAAINCNSRPDCIKLGYNKTAAQCTGRSVMKCPWDTTWMYCSLSTPTCDDDKTYVDGEGCKDGITYCATKGQTFYERLGCGDCSSDKIFDSSTKGCVDGMTYCNAQWKKFKKSTCEACPSGEVVNHENNCVLGINYCTDRWFIDGVHTEGIYNADAQKCEKCPTGQFGDKAQNACKSPDEQCGDASKNKIYKDDGTCTCKDDYAPDQRDTTTCVLIGSSCDDTRRNGVYNNSGECVCDTDAGYNEDNMGDCIICNLSDSKMYNPATKSCMDANDYCYSKGQTFTQGECRSCSEGNFVEQPGPYCTKCNGYVKDPTTCIRAGDQCDDTDANKVATADGQCVCDASNNYMNNPSAPTGLCVNGPNFCPNFSQEYDTVTNTCKPCSSNQHFDSEKKKCICDDGFYDLGDGACGLPVNGFDYDDIVNNFPGQVSGMVTDCRCTLSGGCCTSSQQTELCCSCDANGRVEGCPIISAPPSGGTVVVP